MSFDQLHRRSFITLLGGAVAWPLAARAQQPAMPVIGFLDSESPEGFPHLLRAFHHGLGAAGYVEGRNVAIVYHWARGQMDQLPALAADLVARQVSVIVANGPSAMPAKAATTTIPIVFFSAADPVATGLVTSLSRPGGNVTGVTSQGIDIGVKRLELLHELLPAATAISLLVNPTQLRNAETLSRDGQAAARALGLRLHLLQASSERDFDRAFIDLGQLGAGGLAIGPDAFFASRTQQLAKLALRHAVPTVFQDEFAAAGGLMSYGGSFIDVYRLVGGYAGRILNGTKPADLPVQQSTKIELVINLKTAKALGLTVPPTLLARADEAIE
jgi:putative tryptophan/tyrosine transport system substrate-binding protein